MNASALKKIETEAEMVALLKEHDLYVEDDVTFDSFDFGNMYLYTGDDFELDADKLSALEISALLIRGSVRAEYFNVSDVLGDTGVFCVTGNVHCQDMLYMTECTSVMVGGDLVIGGVCYADCGNSGLHVHGSLRSKLLFNFQCSIEVRGVEAAELDRDASPDQLQALGIVLAPDQRPAAAVREYFRRYES